MEAKMKKKMLAVLAILWLVTTPGLAHSWYPVECCAGDNKSGDCRPVRCEEITRDAMGSFIWHGYKFGTIARVSQDDSCHVCIQINPNVPSVAEPRCIFLRPHA
jgi:hypothetical protein